MLDFHIRAMSLRAFQARAFRICISFSELSDHDPRHCKNFVFSSSIKYKVFCSLYNYGDGKLGNKVGNRNPYIRNTMLKPRYFSILRRQDESAYPNLSSKWSLSNNFYNYDLRFYICKIDISRLSMDTNMYLVLEQCDSICERVEGFCVFLYPPILLGRSLMIGWRKPWKGALSSHSVCVCLSVC